MARAHSFQDMTDPARDPQPGEWQALRGELVALLDQVEGRYAQAEQIVPVEPALSGLSQRVRNLRDQVIGPEPAMRRQEALRTVKRAVDRFSEREEMAPHDDEHDALSSAIAEIRGRQMSGTAAALGRRAADAPEFRELNALVSGLSGRLERLEGDLRTQRTSNGSVHEVASQVEQLTHVVELLAGAVGETGQVKRLEAQIGALAAMIEQGPKVDLSAINKRLDDVSTTVGKLAELQAQQMEREIVREDRAASAPTAETATIAPAMHAIEASVRNVYDRIDSIERNVGLSAGEFERLTAEMAAFTQAMSNGDAAPGVLINKVDALAARIGDFETASGDVAALKQDVTALRDAVLSGMQPRFDRIETQLEALSHQIKPAADGAKVENQLKQLMKRMDEAGAQLNGLTKLYTESSDATGLEAMATLVAERTSDAVTRKAPAPVAMFGPESLKSIEDKLAGLIKSAGKTPDYETLAELVAERTSQAVAKAAPSATGAGISHDSMSELEQRMTALFNTAGKDTAERLTRLEAALSNRAAAAAAPSAATARTDAPVVQTAPKPAPGFGVAAPVAPTPNENRAERLEAMLSALGTSSADADDDAMPSNPGDDAPLVDPGFGNAGPVRSALAAKIGATRPATADVLPPARTAKPATTAPAPSPAAEKPSAAAEQERPSFDPGSVQRPPRPESSFSPAASETFKPAASSVSPAEARISQNSTSTFVAAARRAQRARAESAAPEIAGGSVISRALSRFMPDKSGDAPEPAVDKREPRAASERSLKAENAETPEKPEKPAKPVRSLKLGLGKSASKPVDADIPIAPVTPVAPDQAPQSSFIVRHRRPLLLAAALVAVSMLALNLVIQRMSSSQLQRAAVEAPQPAPAATPGAEPTASQDVSLVRPEPRIIDMVDDTATASINPNVSSFTRSTTPATPMPPALLASTGGNGATFAPSTARGANPVTTGSIGAPTATPDTFDLPVEATGPIELRQAAADGDARAQFEIAAIFSEGRAVEQSYEDAAIWYERAAAQGFVPAQYRLGNLYETGTGVEKDLELAKLWYQRAAEADNRMAMHNLAALYASGQMGEQAFETAAEWFGQAAVRGMTDSQFNLGMLYARGLGVSQDFEQSYKWFSLAAMGGDADAAKAREDIAKSLSAEAVARVGAELATWKAEPIDLAANFAPIGTWSDKFVAGEAITAREVITKVQMALGKLGFDIGTPDGVVGPKTAEAIRSFERGTGMSETGVINPRLLAVLGSQPV